ncbi:MAG: membrane dipeptidase [Clostridia bacterium]|nr:membrane dipeptidase [Clostridia bacterium]
MKLSVFDFHCDTAGEMLRSNQSLTHNSLAVSLVQATQFEHYVQVMAHWIDHRLDDQAGWEHLLSMHQNLLSDAALQNGDAVLCTACPDLSVHTSLLLSLEDARVLDGHTERVDLLYEMGFRLITPLWRGLTCIGGSHDTDQGLTAFGKAALTRALRLGMILDVSHASVESAADIFELSGAERRPVIASHSNAYEICPVSRNLRKDQIQSILDSDGIIGLNFCQDFLRLGGNARVADVFPHVDYFLEQGASHALCLGGDMDGCELPSDLPTLSALALLAEQMLSHNYSEALVKAIFFENAYAFSRKHLS